MSEARRSWDRLPPQSAMIADKTKENGWKIMG